MKFNGLIPELSVSDITVSKEFYIGILVKDPDGYLLRFSQTIE